MKTLILALGLSLASTSAFAQNWNNSPYNWQNSPSNWQNSSSNWANSPSNWNNSPTNFNSNNGIYDANGTRQGYAVQRQDGSGVNIYSNSGQWMGYSNGQ